MVIFHSYVKLPEGTNYDGDKVILSGWWWLEPWNLIRLSICWEFHHPNWRTHIFQRDWNHQPGGLAIFCSSTMAMICEFSGCDFWIAMQHSSRTWTLNFVRFFDVLFLPQSTLLKRYINLYLARYRKPSILCSRIFEDVQWVSVLSIDIYI